MPESSCSSDNILSVNCSFRLELYISLNPRSPHFAKFRRNTRTKASTTQFHRNGISFFNCTANGIWTETLMFMKVLLHFDGKQSHKKACYTVQPHVFGLPFTASHYCFGKVFPICNFPAFYFMHAYCPNGDGNQSSFGRVRYYFVNYRTFGRR